MDIKIIVDKQSELRMSDAAEKLKEYCSINNVKAYNRNILVIFSNDYSVVKEASLKVQKNTVVINVTENLSEQHVINVLKYVTDICYLKSDVNVIATRIIKAYNKDKMRLRQNV